MFSIFTSRCTEDVFNPKAAAQKFLSHTLIELLNQVNSHIVSTFCFFCAPPPQSVSPPIYVSIFLVTAPPLKLMKLEAVAL